MQTLTSPAAAWPETLPPQATPFFGRQSELSEIRARLADPECRLLTLIGPGGAGKTRLALEAAAASAEQFSDGVYFANLEPVRSLDMLVHALVGALRLPLSGQEDAFRQVITQLHDKELLLVLDNFEHLVEGAEMIAYILRYTNRIKLLATSRVALNLVEEHLYPLSGMPFPPLTAEAEDLSVYPAVQMFTSCARRVRPGFNPEIEREGLLRICRLVDGMPLGIELAASWTRMMSCAEIANEIERNIHFLAAGLRNLPERHRSIQAVFQHSWDALQEEQRQAFMRLAIFQDGFRREAAREVAGASLATLSALVDHSLLRRAGKAPSDQETAAGLPNYNVDRFKTHELLRQFAWEKLAEDEQLLNELRDRHSEYFLRWCEDRLKRFHSGEQLEVMAELRADYQNVRSALDRALERGEAGAEGIAQSAMLLHYFFQIDSRYLEGAETMSRAVQILKEHIRQSEQPSTTIRFALALVLTGSAWFCIRLGRYDEALQAGEESLKLFGETHPAPPAIGSDALIPLAVLAQVRGDFEQALALARHARQHAEARGDGINRSTADYAMAGAYLAMGKYDLAHQHARSAVLYAETTRSDWFKAYALVEWGNAAAALGDYDQAKRHFQSAYAIREVFGDPEGMAVALNHLGQIALLQEDFEEAGQLFAQSRVIYEKIHDAGGLATSLDGLCQAALAQGELPLARDLAIQALETTSSIGFVPLTLSVLCSVSALFFRAGQDGALVENGIRLLDFVRQHPAAGQETRQRAETLLAARASSGAAQPAENPAPLPDLPAAVHLALGQLATNTFASRPAALQPDRPAMAVPVTGVAAPGPGLSDGTAPRALTEPLSERELDVLRGMAGGLSNQEIAAELVLSLGTVKWYTSQIYGKLGVNSRTRAVARARELKILA